MKFATKLMRQYLPHLRRVATLPCEIKNSNFLQIRYNSKSESYSADIAEMQTYCTLIASNFVVHPQIWIFSVFKIASLSSY